MKKVVFILFIISLMIMFQKKETYVIPSDAIRFRIIANSNSLKDQTKKLTIKNKIKNQLSELLDENNADDTRKTIVENLDSIKDIVSKETSDYKVEYGYNFFPKKEYKGVIYPAGEYESLVVTLGNGLGENWWCVLYPPLCFIEDETPDNYAFYLKEIFDKIVIN